MTTYHQKPSKPRRGARNKIRRHAERGHYDREAVEAILDASFVGHVAFIADGLPHATPMLYVRDGDQLYLHGSPRSRLLELMVAGAPLCFNVMLLDGLVLSRSWFHHSINYRSVVVFGEGRAVRDRAEKLEAMRKLVDQIVPGRAADSRGPTPAELKATEIVAMEISEASAKVRVGNPVDLESEHAMPTWAGQLPLRLTAGNPLPDPYCTAPVPGYIQALFSDAD